MEKYETNVLNESINFFKEFKNTYSDFYNDDNFIYSSYNDETSLQLNKLIKIGVLKDEYAIRKEFKTSKKINEMNIDEVMYLLADLFCSERVFTGVINESIKNGNIIEILNRISELSK